MAKINKPLISMRIIHRYLGYFLAGIMTVYAVSGIVLIFRDTNFLKQEKQVKKNINPQAKAEELGKMLDIKELKVDREDGVIMYFKEGTYNKESGLAEYKVYRLPVVLEKMTHLHKAKSAEPLFFLNIFFGTSLLFFVISAFWMYLPKTTIFKKGIYFTLAGVLLTLLLLFL